MIEKVKKSKFHLLHNVYTAWFVLVFGIIVTAAAWYISNKVIQNDIRRSSETRASEIGFAIQARMKGYEQVLWSGVGLFNASEAVTRDEFRAFVDALRISEQWPGIQGIGYSIPVAANELEQHTNTIRSEGFPDYRIKPEYKRADYTAIIYLEPFDWRNQRAFGYDMWSNQLRREAMTYARDNGVAATSGIITLVQETDEDVQKGFLTYVPLYKGNGPLDTVEQRREAFVGWVYSPFRVGDLMLGILGEDKNNFEYEIFDGTELNPDNLLYESNAAFYEDAASSTDNIVIPIQIQNRVWTLRFTPQTDLYDTRIAKTPTIIAMIGFSIDLILFYIISSLAFQQRRAELIATEINVELDKSQEQLQLSLEAAELSESRLRLANDSAKIGVWEWDLRTNELVWDDGMYRLYGITKEQFTGAYDAWEKGIHPEDIDFTRKKLDGAIAGTDTYDPEFRVVWPDESIKVLKAGAEVIRNDSGEAIKLIGVNYDITEKTNLIQELEAAKKLAEQSVVAKDSFLANMSHEIRTPMNGIYGTLQLLNQKQQDTQSQELIDNAIFSTKNLLTIINDILDFSKIEAGKLKLEIAPFNLITVIDSVMSDFKSIVSEKDINLTSDIAEKLPAMWNGDPVRIRQILMNLVSNAVKFTDQGEIRLNVDVTEEMQSVRFSITDTGIGMSQDTLTKLFERFEQADTSTTRNYGGTGLGMSITASLIDLMGGEITVNSSVGQGTECIITLPLTLVDTVTEVRDSSEKLLCPNLSGKRILVAEDNQVNALIIRKMLADTKATVSIAKNGEEAVQFETEDQHDLILMDIQMPILDGMAACKIIRDSGVKTPIIAFTANVLTDDVKKYKSEGFDDCLSKPVEIKKLYQILQDYLR